MKRILALAAILALLATAGCSAAKPAAVGTAPQATAPTTSTSPGPSTAPAPADDGIIWRQGGIGYPLKSDDPRAKGQKVVMLSFDDGPLSDKQGGATAEILDILKKENIKATFFVTGYGIKNLDLLQREIAGGHTIGTHTMTHGQLWKLQTKEAIEKEILPVNAEVEKYTGKPVKYFRPPNGMYNDPHGYIKEVAKENGLEIINWTTGALDWQMKDPQKITDQVLKTVVPGAVVLMHDTHKWTAAALPMIIKGLREKGYEFVTIR